MPNQLLGILFGQITCIDRLSLQAIPRRILLAKKEHISEEFWGILCWMRTLICKTKLFPSKKLRLGFSPPLHLFCFRFFFGIRHTAVSRFPLLRSRTLLLAFGFLLFRFLHYFPSLNENKKNKK